MGNDISKRTGGITTDAALGAGNQRHGTPPVRPETERRLV